MVNSRIQNNMVDKKDKKFPPSDNLNSGGKDRQQTIMKWYNQAMIGSE